MRQINLLSPFLFVIVMETSSKMTSAIVNGGFLFGFSVGTWNVGGLTSLIFCLRMTFLYFVG